MIGSKEIVLKNKDTHLKNEALCMASQNGHIDLVEALLAGGADINKEDIDGITPLSTASENGHIDLVKALLAVDADVNKEDTDGTTPLFIASQNGHTGVVKALLKRKNIDVNQADNNGATPLFIASQEGHTALVEALLAGGADVNQVRNDGTTPLFIATQKGHINVVKSLFIASAPPQKESSGKKSDLGASLPELSDFANKKPNREEIVVLRAQCKETESALRILYPPHGKKKKRSSRDRQLVIDHLERCEKLINKVPSWPEDLEFKQWYDYFKTIKRSNKGSLSGIKCSKKRKARIKDLEKKEEGLRKKIAKIEFANARLREKLKKGSNANNTMTEDEFDRLMNAEETFFDFDWRKIILGV